MVSAENREKIRNWFESHREEFLGDLASLVAIRSVSDEQSAVKPFGQGCRDVFDKVFEIARKYGYESENYDYYVAKISGRERAGARKIGVWGHLDVVPEGDGWIHEPYKMEVMGDWAVGRGADDNKGPALGALYVLRCLDELGFERKSDMQIFYGASEETGMGDIGHYASSHKLPDFNLVPDSGFPVCHAEKGILKAEIRSLRAISGIRELEGGLVSNMVPSKARATMIFMPSPRELPEGISIDGGEIRAVGIAKHAANPEGGVNAIRRLTGFLEKYCDGGEILSFLNRVNDTTDGAALGMKCADDVTGALTCVGSLIRLDFGRPVLTINVRYPATIDSAGLIANAKKACEADGYEFVVESDSAPAYVPKDNPNIVRMMKVYNDVTGQSAEPYTMGGGTYARELTNAVAYGMGGLPLPEGVKVPDDASGKAHEHDEGLYIPNLLKAMEIYALTVLAID